MSKTLPQIGGTGRAGGAVGGESVAPEFFGVQTSDPAPRIDNSPYFLFRHHPNDWIVKGGAVIPQLRKLKLVNGINNVTNSKGPDGKLTWDISTAQTMIQKKGGVVIPAQAVPPAHGKTSYIQKVKGTNAYLSIYETAYAGSSEITTDEGGYVEFCQYLIAEGYIQQPPAYILGKLQGDLLRDLASAERSAERSPVYGDVVKNVRAQLAVVAAAIAAKPKLPARGDDDAPAIRGAAQA